MLLVINHAPRVINYVPRAINYAPRAINYDPTIINYALTVINILLESLIMLLDPSIMLLELSIMLLENIYSIGIALDDCHMMIPNTFIAQATSYRGHHLKSNLAFPVANLHLEQ
jgi:hypothetical protein